MRQSNVIRCIITPQIISATGGYYDDQGRHIWFGRTFDDEQSMYECFKTMREAEDFDFQLVVERVII